MLLVDPMEWRGKQVPVALYENSRDVAWHAPKAHLPPFRPPAVCLFMFDDLRSVLRARYMPVARFHVFTPCFPTLLHPPAPPPLLKRGIGE